MRRCRPYHALVVFLALALAAATAPASAQSLTPDEREVIAAVTLGDGVTLESLRASTEDQGLRELIETLLAAARLDQAAARSAFARYQGSESVTPTGVAAGWSAITSAAFATGDYAAASAAAAEWRDAIRLAGDPSGDREAAQTQTIAAMLSRAPSQSMVESSPRIAVTTVDGAGLVRVPVTINGISTSAVLDTGANLSVVSASEAARLGLDLIDGTGSVGSSSRETVAVRIGVANRLEIAGAVLRHVAFLVMDDTALTFPLPGGYRIDAIVGLPVFKSLGRTTLDRSGEFLWERGVSGSAPPNVYARGSNLHVVVDLAGQRLPLHLDTGATSSGLSSAAAERYAGTFTDQTETQRSGGAGGVTETQVRRLPPATLAIGGVPMCHSGLTLQVTSREQPDSLGVIGQDVLTAFQSYTLDLGSMTFDLGPPTGSSDTVKVGACTTILDRPEGLRPLDQGNNGAVPPSGAYGP